jgi:hypothetical protein
MLPRKKVDYLLFVNEAPLAGKIRGTSGFVEKLSARGRPIARAAACGNSTWESDSCVIRATT